MKRIRPLISERTPRRIVSLQPSATVTLRDLGQLDRLVACTKYCVDVCPEAGTGRQIVDDSWTAHAEEIRATRPDLVIASVPYQEKSVAEILKAGVRFLGLAPHSLEDIYTDIATIAALLGVPDRGQEVVARMQREIDAVHARTRNLPRPRVFCEEWGKPIIASQTWVKELVEAAGGTFIGEPGRQQTHEDVSHANPDVLIAAWCGAGDRVPLEKIVRERGWSQLRAVEQRRVYCIRDEFLNTPASTLVSGLYALAGAIHPEIFPQVEGLRQIADVPAQSHTMKGL
jgi:iron complex transport system substrate-binding protein